ncbi:DHA2 family multidrug resistance protein-like MFS transporter [Geodermatophilus tzadiensis]|uniref:DHA2 family multidrug resistance protein-like MFS transporter n=1 Tax=Geodermatophilus tzadiensis TaxID=1137988 RepID=A0A2T0TWX0_9ACTN|nr:MFS transporter [Geodermatophilus tzadiensis]PRY50194.1 DHA2 family multidrug resistance protein-like MFS transporter [Geodermatophilus tzadiensis]
MTPLRRWSALAVLALPVLLISVDMTVLGFAVPALTADLRPTSTGLLWIVDIYSFLLAGLLVLMGNVGDRIGRRRLLVAGAAAFGCASLLAAFAASPAMLIGARALLGLGGATLMPSTLALLRSVFPDARERRLAIAVWAAAFSGGAALGPIVGGVLLEHFWWGSVFLANVPVMVLLLVSAPLVLPESRNPRPGPFDALSAVLSIAGVLPVVYALKTAAHDGLGGSVLVALAAGLGLLWTFVRRQRRLAEPLLDLRLFASRAFTVAVTTNLLTVFALLGLMFFLPQYLVLVLGMSPLLAGLWMLPLALATVAGSLAAPWLARRLPLRWVIGGGMALAAAGLAAATGLGVDGDRAVLVAAGLLIGAGVGAAEALTNDVVLTTAPPERAGAAAAVSETAYEFGGAMGTAVLGTLGLAVYAAHLDGVDGVPADATGAARETLGGATEAAAGLPADAAGALLAEAGQAFVTGMHAVLVVAALTAAYVAVQAVVLLRGPAGTPAAPAPRERPAAEPVAR